MRWLDGITDSTDMRLSTLREIVGQGRTPGVLLSIGLQRVGRDVVTKQQQQIRYNTGNSTQYSVITYMRKGASLVAQTIRDLPVMQETWVESLGWEDPLEEEIATHTSILAWKIPKTEEPGRLQATGLQRVGHD